MKLTCGDTDTGIPMMTFGIIMGVPDDNAENLKLTEKKCMEIKELVEKKGVQTYFTPFLNILLPGTPNYEKYKHLLQYDIEKYPELFQFHTATLGVPGFTTEELTRYKREIERRVNGVKATKFWGSTGKYYFQESAGSNAL